MRRATARAPTAGVYRSPFSLPNGEILASYAANVATPWPTFPGMTWSRSPPTAAGARWSAAATQSYVEAALGYKRAERELFRNLPQLVFGGHGDPAGDAAGDGDDALPRPARAGDLAGRQPAPGSQRQGVRQGGGLSV